MKLARISIPLLLLCAALAAQDSLDPKHLAHAHTLVRALDLSHTNYEHGHGSITWDGSPESHTDCSGFATMLLKHAYGYDDAQFKKWFGGSRPHAVQYHDTIEKQTGFTQIASLNDVRAGDFIAIKY